MAARIVLFGATGYTGRLTAERMVARGLSPVLAARSAEKLTAMAAELGGLETATADVGRPASVRGLVERGDVLVSTVGPFARWGGPALDAAIEAGAHYMDSTGEPAFIRRVFERESTRAKAADCSLLTALGYDWVPGNLAGALALRAGGGGRDRGADRLLHDRRGRSRRDERRHQGLLGRRRPRARLLLARGAVGDRALGGPGRRLRVRRPRAAGDLGRLQPRPSRCRGSTTGCEEVDVYLGWFGGASRAMSALSLAMSGVRAIPGAQGAVEGLMGRFVKGSTGGPGPDERARSGSEVVAEARDAAGETLARVRLVGVDAYGFTAAMLAWAAERAAAGELSGTGRPRAGRRLRPRNARGGRGRSGHPPNLRILRTGGRPQASSG